MKQIILILSLVSCPLINSAFAQSADKRVVIVKPKLQKLQLDLAPVSAKLTVAVKNKVEKPKSEDQDVARWGDCSVNLKGDAFEETGKCLELKTPGKSGWTQIPVVVSNTTGAKGFESIGAQQTTREEKDWGAQAVWTQTSGESAKYFFLIPKEAEKMLRIGPIMPAVLKSYELNLSLESW